MSDKEVVKQILTDLNDQKDFLQVIYSQLEELYAMKIGKQSTEFETGFLFGDIYRLFVQYKNDSERLSLEIGQFLANKTFEIKVDASKIV
jgi:hypothetical protein